MQTPIPPPFETTVKGLPSGAVLITQRSEGVETSIYVPAGCEVALCNAIHHANDSRQCPHGRVVGECNDCDVAADFAYDAAREDRVFGRGR